MAFVEGKPAPCGIHGFKFSEEVKAIGKKHFSAQSKFEEPKAMRFAPIESLSIMGSAGSIAQTEGSDLDYWVTIRDDLPQSKRNVLQKKLTQIEKWCWNTLGAEVHFFVSTPTAIRNNDYGSVDKESCGTALGKLLKEEYYRTSLHVMGKIPLWWLAPYNADDQLYSTIPDHLSNEGPELNKDDFIDYGNIRTIPSGEFVGGGMWQLNKGVGSPFKSALKMGLLVEYADTTKPRDLLAQMLKRRMFENANDMERLDPYQMMVERAIAYHTELGEQKSAEILQKCLFLKMETKISRWWNSKRAPDHRTLITLLAMVRSWNWTIKDVEKWENFDTLPMSELVAFKKDLESYMFSSLKKLRSLDDGTGTKAVSASDFKKMTQRLATIFNPDPERIEWFYKPYDKMIKSDVYSLMEEKQGKDWTWNVYTGVIDDEGQLSKSTAKKLLRTESTLAELITWMLFNQLIRAYTKLFITHRSNIPFKGNLMRLSGSFYKHIGIPQLPSLDDDTFARDSYPIKWMIVVNLVPFMATKEAADIEDELDPENEDQDNAELSTKGDVDGSALIADELSEALSEAGYQDKAEKVKGQASQKIENVQVAGKTIPLRAGRVSAQEDPFNVGPDACSIYQEIFLVELNSWGEVFAKKMPDAQPAAETIRSIVEETLKQQKREADIFCEMGHGPYAMKETHHRFVTLITSITEKLLTCQNKTAVAIFKMNGEYNVLIRYLDRVDLTTHEHFPDAVHHANLRVRGDTHFFFDHDDPRLKAHQDIYNQSKKGENLLHLMESDEGLMLSCIDQTGCYIFDAMEKSDFAEQWPAFLLSFLNATRNWTTKDKVGKSRIVKQKKGQAAATEMTDQVLSMLTKMKSRLPRTQMQVDSREGFKWLARKAGTRNNPSPVEKELSAALAIHNKSEDRPFILSSIRIQNRENHNYAWPPSVQLQLRQCLIRKGRRLHLTLAEAQAD